MCRRSRGPRWDIAVRNPEGFESSDHLEIVGVSLQSNDLGIERVQLTIYSRAREAADDREFLGLCDRMRGDRGLLTVYLWSPLAEAMSLGLALVARQFVEVELRVRGFFRSKGRVQSIEFRTQMSACDVWAIEVADTPWPEEAAGPGELTG